tara:strand:- start:1203 stop:1598 length:396 start_codon:yes stop_codon:yes gene_type:complete
VRKEGCSPHFKFNQEEKNMPYELKEGQGSLFSQPSAEVLGKGEILVDGQKHWVYVLQEFDRDGKPKFALLSESGFKGRLFFNPQEEKQNPASSDFGGYITLNNIDYKLSMWQKSSVNGNSYLSVSAKRKTN